MGKLSTGLGSIIRGELNPLQAMLEVGRRGKAVFNQRCERASFHKLNLSAPGLHPDFQSLSSSEILTHFRKRASPLFFPGFQSANTTASLQRELFPDATERLIRDADAIIEHRWPLLGLGEIDFAHVAEQLQAPHTDFSINWLQDPLSGKVWPLNYHADLPLQSGDGSDVRVLWELNRLGHFITLGRAFAITCDERYPQEICAQLASWRRQNPVGLGPNWSCAMEVALRAMNLLSVLSLCRQAETLTADRAMILLAMLETHGAHIKRNLEFSYFGNSNHYLTDVAGLLWLGLMLPELRVAAEWRSWALPELLRELDKQILADGADHEGSTGYHRYVLELFLYSFLLCRENRIEIDNRHWHKLEAMLDYLHAYLAPDGFAPLVGDSDGGQVLPVTSHSAVDHAYLLDIGAASLRKSDLRKPRQAVSEELLWMLGEQGIAEFESLAPENEKPGSRAFPEAGVYLLRHEDLYLLFNAVRNHRAGRAAHRHNDALSIEVSAGGRRFIVDPGTYVYTADLDERHRFRSTAYHSTVVIDETEQNSIERSKPFLIGNAARPRVISWDTGPDRDSVRAEHYGYQRLRHPVTHRRSVTFYKSERWWLIEDQFGIQGETGEHEVAAYFHFDSGLEVKLEAEGVVSGLDINTSVQLLICALDSQPTAQLVEQFSSTNYGAKQASVSACWKARMRMPATWRWAIIPILAQEDPAERLGRVQARATRT